MSRADRFDFTLDEETEKRLYDLMTDMDTRRTNCFWIKDKRGYHAEYVKIIRCKDCSYHYGTICRRDSTFPWEDDDYCSKAEVEE